MPDSDRDHDLDLVAREIIDANRYLTLATADGDAQARRVAAGALVLLASPCPDDPAAGLLLLAVDAGTAAELAAAATTATLTLSLPPPSPPPLTASP